MTIIAQLGGKHMQITVPGLYKSGKGKMIHFSPALGIGQGSVKQRVCVP